MCMNSIMVMYVWYLMHVLNTIRTSHTHIIVRKFDDQISLLLWWFGT